MTLQLRLLGDLAELTRLRDALRVPPLDRPDEHDVVPHVTLLQRAAAEVIDAAVAEALGFVAVRSGLWVRQVGPPAALAELGSPP